MQQRRTPSAKFRTTALYWGVCANEATANPQKNHAHIIHVNSISIHHEMRSFPPRTRARARARKLSLVHPVCLSLTYAHAHYTHVPNTHLFFVCHSLFVPLSMFRCPLSRSRFTGFLYECKRIKHFHIYICPLVI